MIEIRRFSDLGHFQTDWLNAKHHFSFGGYYDPAHMGHGKLRVWNDDIIKPKTGFPTHGHRDMEIITYVRTGAITHKDSMGNTGRTEAGDVQVMSAGTGVQHSEWNHEGEDTTLFQIWIEPAKTGVAPGWGAAKFPKAGRSGKWAVLASGDASSKALSIHQDAHVLGATLNAGETLAYEVTAGRYGYLVLAAGQVEIDGQTLDARDGAAITGPQALTITARQDAEIVFVDTV
ncbi:MAG: pirin family protein [Pseudomonadota bacterium]